MAWKQRMLSSYGVDIPTRMLLSGELLSQEALSAISSKVICNIVFS